MNNTEENITLVVHEPATELDRLYEKAELDQLREALKRTPQERFLMATRLYKMRQTLKKAEITYTTYTLDK